MTVNEKVEDLSHRGECITGRSEIGKIEPSRVSYVFEEQVSPYTCLITDRFIPEDSNNSVTRSCEGFESLIGRDGYIY